MKAKILLITPPFTQLNTTYPATTYLKGFLNTIGYDSFQTDLGIETFLMLFCKQGFYGLFEHIELHNTNNLSDNSKRIIALKNDYCNTVDNVIRFLQGKNPTLAYSICQQRYLPQASRFNNVIDLNEAFGAMGIQNKAKHLCTLYIEDIFDLIVECVDANFGLNRYAEHLARSANSFDGIYDALKTKHTYIENLFIDLLKNKINIIKPELVAITIPFPGNLFSALRCTQWIKKNYPEIKITFGGGYVNTELRSLSDNRVFEFVDFITLDDGETPLKCLLEYIDGKRSIENLIRCFTSINNQVTYINNYDLKDYDIADVGTPDYSDLPLDKYVSLIEVANPMHSLWSDGRWNKLTMAHGCYWAKCSFCDTSLNYIGYYKALNAKQLCDRIEQIVKQTGQTGFHFVDEAAPPTLMRELALEIIRRKLTITWWTNIRFEKNFTVDLCYLLKASGCIAVSGGLEVASNRLLQLINKGVTVEQVAKVTQNFTQAGIMVHAYLMYGFPSQTAQEIIDSLEMVRQIFKQGIIHSAFWHIFTMTVHSPVGICPEKFGIQRVLSNKGAFANNDLEHIDKVGVTHTLFGDGLKTALFNYMHGVGFDMPLQQWFTFKIPRTSVPNNFIVNSLNANNEFFVKPDNKIVWLGGKPIVTWSTKIKKGQQFELCTLRFHSKTGVLNIDVDKKQADWLLLLFDKIDINNTDYYSINDIKQDYENTVNDNFELFFYSKPMNNLRKNGLLVL